LGIVITKMSNTVKDIVDSYLCTQCGTCVSVCPVHAIAMRETPAGLLTPFILEEKCIACGKCREREQRREVVLAKARQLREDVSGVLDSVADRLQGAPPIHR